MNKLISLMICIILTTLAPATIVGQDADGLTPNDRILLKELSGVTKTEKIIFHYRPNDFDENTIEKVVNSNKKRFEECKKLLAMDFKGRVHIFLYLSIEDLQKTTETPAVAFSTGTVSIHQAIDFDSVHELTHIFAMQFPRDAHSTTDMFLVEGLATILAVSDEGVPIQSWVSVLKSVGRLPKLLSYRKNWPEDTPSGFHSYYIPASFVGYLIEQYGIEKVKLWYINSTEAYMAFGKTLPNLESDWLDWLDNVKVEDAHRSHVLNKLGLSPVPKIFVKGNGNGKSLLDGKTLTGWKVDDPSSWSFKNGNLIGKNKQAWTLLHSEREFPENVGVRMKFRLVEGDAVTLRINRVGENVNQTVMAKWAFYFSAKGGGFLPISDLKLTHKQWNEVVFINENGTGRLYLNGLLAGEVPDQLHSQKGSIGIGVEKGVIEVEEIVVFDTNSTNPKAPNE